MALNPRDVPITRGQVHGWVETWTGDTTPDKPTLEDYVRTQVAALNLPDDMVNTAGHSGLPDEMTVADLLVRDLGSYAHR